LAKTCFQNVQKCVFLGVILQNFPGGMSPDSPKMVVPLALPVKLICDEIWPPFGNCLRSPLMKANCELWTYCRQFFSCSTFLYKFKSFRLQQGWK